MNKSIRGMGLFEMLIVIVIITAIAMASISGFMTSKRKNEVTDFASSLGDTTKRIAEEIKPVTGNYGGMTNVILINAGVIPTVWRQGALGGLQTPWNTPIVFTPYDRVTPGDQQGMRVNLSDLEEELCIYINRVLVNSVLRLTVNGTEVKNLFFSPNLLPDSASIVNHCTPTGNNLLLYYE